jgi:hypothetical protein
MYNISNIIYTLDIILCNNMETAKISGTGQTTIPVSKTKKETDCYLK